jgi:hypothetical protein
MRERKDKDCHYMRKKKTDGQLIKKDRLTVRKETDGELVKMATRWERKEIGEHLVKDGNSWTTIYRRLNFRCTV